MIKVDLGYLPLSIKHSHSDSIKGLMFQHGRVKVLSRTPEPGQHRDVYEYLFLNVIGLD
jgi:hypothetical protein